MKFLPLTLTAAVVLTFSSATSAQSLNSAAQRMFDDLGAVGNVTAPQAFHGQTLSTYTGGSVFIRSPTKTYSLGAVNLPYVRSGCGGIDLFGGSFSHISSDEFKAMLKNITSALPSVIFQMMLKSVEPVFATTVEWFKNVESFVNRANINSCEAATSLAGSLMDQAGFDSVKFCERAAGAASTIGIDAEAARDRCRKAHNVNSTLNTAASDPNLKEAIPFSGNLVWAALKKLNHLDDRERELIMSITGTTIYARPVDGQSEPRPIAPTVTTITDVLYGNVEGGAALPTDHVRVKLLRCANSDCTNVTETHETMQSLTARVRELMTSLSNKIALGSEKPSPEEINFVNRVPAPVYRLLSSSNAINNPAIAESKISQYAQYVAVEFAHGLLARAARMGLGTAQFNVRLNEQQIAQLNIHRGNADVLLRTLESERAVAENRQQTMQLIGEDIDRLDRSLRAAMPQQVADLLGYATGGTY